MTDIFEPLPSNVAYAAGTLPQGNGGTGSASGKSLSIFMSPLRGVPMANESTMCGTGTWPGTTTGNTVTGHNTRKQFIANRNSSFVRVVYAHWMAIDTLAGQSSLLQPLQIRATVEPVAGTYIPVTFNGSQDGICPVGGFLVSDPIYIYQPNGQAAPIIAGQQFWVKTYVAAQFMTFSNTSPNNTVVAWGEYTDATFNVASADKTQASVGTASASGYYPLCVVGDLGIGLPYVGILGDSIAAGLGDAAAISVYGHGYIRRALANTIPFIDLSYSGDHPSTAGNFTFRLKLLVGITDLICEEGINDIAFGTTLSATQQALINLWVAAKVYGVSRVWQTTMMPVVTSSDGLATTINQTPTTYESARVALNTWLRDGAPLVSASNLTPAITGTVGALRMASSGHPLQGIFDPSALIEVNSNGVLTLNGGRWPVGLVSTTQLASGIYYIHPESPGCVTAAASINTALFQG